MAGYAASPVTVGVITVLQDATLQQLAPGGAWDDVPQHIPDGTFLWVEVFPERETSGLGGHSMPEVEFRVHTYDRSSKEAAQVATARVVVLLRNARLTIEGYQQAGHVVYGETVPAGLQELNGVKVHEVVSNFRLWVEEV